MANGEVRCIDSELPFEVPCNWSWERWGNLAFSIMYGYNAPAIEKGDIRMVRISDIQNNQVNWGSVPFCKIKETDIDTYLLKPNDILFARTGGTVGKSYIVKSVPHPAIYAGYLIRTRYSQQLCPQFLKYFMESPLYWDELKEGTTATAQPNCNGKKLASMLLPVPPVQEQLRIVSRLEELLLHIDKYDAAQTQLDRLNIDIYSQLRKSILQEAIQGHLVPQDPTEEPAEELLKRINKEKEKLVREGKLKRKDVVKSNIFKGEDNKYYEQIGSNCMEISEEIPFDIPDTWEWARLSQCCVRIFSGRSPEYSKNPTKHIIIGQQANQWEHIEMQYAKYGTEDFVTKIEDYQYLLDGDVLLNTLGNGTLGRCGIFENVSDSGRVLTDGHLFVFRTVEKTISKYILYFLTLNYTEINKKADGSTNQTFLNLKKVSKYLIPLPPLKEMERIVAKKENLYSKL